MEISSSHSPSDARRVGGFPRLPGGLPHLSIGAEIAIKAWDVRDPAVRQRVFLVPVVAPVFLLPLFQLFRPERGSTYFRSGTIFESGRWLELEMFGTHPVM